MNEYQKALMDKPGLVSGYCVICGESPTTPHHAVPRSQGGRDGPTLSLCGSGTWGCHGLAEDKKLHFRYHDGWWWLRTEGPMKYDRALDADGWARVGNRGGG